MDDPDLTASQKVSTEHEYHLNINKYSPLYEY